MASLMDLVGNEDLNETAVENLITNTSGSALQARRWVGKGFSHQHYNPVVLSGLCTLNLKFNLYGLEDSKVQIYTTVMLQCKNLTSMS